MTQEEKQLLLKDLCARLPYGVKLNVPHYYGDEDAIITLDAFWLYDIQHGRKEIKPYLRPISSMTEEEEEEYELLIDCSDYTYFKTSDKVIDWLNEHHFDYRIDPSTDKTMIESDLALEAPEGIYKIR